MGLLLGTSAAQEATVIFENDTFKAIGIENLEIEGTFYNVKFTSTGTVAAMVYGVFPGVFDFGLPTTAAAAVDAVAFELNKAGATGVGAEGSEAVPFFWLGFESEKGVDPQIETVILYVSLYGEAQQGGAKLWFPGSQPKSDLYNFGTGVWADFEVSVPPPGVLEGTTHQVKLRGLAVEYVPESGFVERGPGPVLIFPAVLRTTRLNGGTGGFDYNINLLTDTELDNDCDEVTVGTLSTYTDENEAVGNLNAANFPETGETLIARFFAQVQTTPGTTGFESVSGWFEIDDGTPPDPDQISRRLRAKAEEKTPENLGLECTVFVP